LLESSTSLAVDQLFTGVANKLRLIGLLIAYSCVYTLSIGLKLLKLI